MTVQANPERRISFSNYQQSMREAEEYLRTTPIWPLVYPRIYTDVGGYASPKVMAVELGSTLLMMPDNMTELPEMYQARIEVAFACQRHRVPTYFVSKELVEAMLHTTPGEVIDWVPMELPHPGAVFVLEDNAFIHPGNGLSVATLAYGRMHHEQRITFPGFNGHAGICQQEALIFVAIAPCDGTYSQVFSSDKSPLIQFNELDEMVRTEKVLESGPLGLPLGEGDHAFTSAYIRLLFNLIFFMQAKPQLIEAGRANGKRSKSGQEFWSPYFLGRQYRYQRQHAAATGSGVSPRFHWRRGHWRWQRHGPKNELLKHILIDPIAVNAE